MIGDTHFVRTVLRNLSRRVYVNNATVIRPTEQMVLHPFIPVYWLKQWSIGDNKIDKSDLLKLKKDVDVGIAKKVAQELTGEII